MNRTAWITVLLTAAVAVLIGFLTLMPEGTLGRHVPWGDKVNHAIAFAVLILPIAALKPTWLPAAIIVMLTYGWAIELIQPHVGRTRDVADWVADAAGLFVGAISGSFISGCGWIRRINSVE